MTVAERPESPEAVVPDQHDDGAAHGVDPVEIARVVFVAAAAFAVWFRLWEPVQAFSIIGVVGTLVGGYPIFKEAVENVVERRMTMELSMTIALLAALSIGQAFTALVITGFVLVAEILEHLTVSRGRDAIGDLLRYLPQTALVRRDGVIADVPTAELAVGDRVLINPGSLVPVDGIVIDGRSFVDEARITGESIPAQKTLDAAVFAGTLNVDGALEVRTTRLGRDTSYGRIIEAVESAERSRAPVERLADRLAGYLVYFALGAAMLTFLLTRNIVATISVIIVAGACGVAAGTPLAVLGAVGRCARLGAIVKGGRYLEALAGIDVVVLDKTGTVTLGEPEVASVTPADGETELALLRAASSAELRSEHPLGGAIVRAARARGIAIAEPETFSYDPGRGIVAERDGSTLHVGNAALFRAAGISLPALAASDGASTSVYVARDGRYLGSIAIADALRPEARDAIAALRRLAIEPVLLTGDVAAVAESVGRDLGIATIVAELLPEAKSAYVRRLVAAGKRVAMVGDGVNDAPALIEATVGVAMGSGTDVARESAGVVLLGNDLLRFVETVKIARRTKAIIMQNFAGTIAVDALGIVLAGIGVLNPLFAAFIHVASELAFILNSTRMLAPRAQNPDGRPL